MNKSKIYNLEGEILLSEELYENKVFFRKMCDSIVEIKIYEILKLNPHPNIVEVYRYNNRYVDIELLDTDLIGVEPLDIKNTMNEVKKYLQKLGIVYIDWKDEQIGINKEGKLKLFDFDGSGIIDPGSLKWIIPPRKYFSYNKAIEKGIIKPLEIDDFAFNENFK